MGDKAIDKGDSTDVAPQKEDLEREKLILEIQQLKNPWWKKPAYVLAALPTLLAVLSLIYGFANGYFQATATKLENQKHDLQVQKDKLEADIKEFSTRRDELEQTNKELKMQVDNLTVELLTEKISKMTQEDKEVLRTALKQSEREQNQKLQMGNNRSR
jgi:hypothetical protein